MSVFGGAGLGSTPIDFQPSNADLVLQCLRHPPGFSQWCLVGPFGTDGDMPHLAHVLPHLAHFLQHLELSPSPYDQYFVFFIFFTLLAIFF